MHSDAFKASQGEINKLYTGFIILLIPVLLIMILSFRKQAALCSAFSFLTSFLNILSLISKSLAFLFPNTDRWTNLFSNFSLLHGQITNGHKVLPLRRSHAILSFSFCTVILSRVLSKFLDLDFLTSEKRVIQSQSILFLYCSVP